MAGDGINDAEEMRNSVLKGTGRCSVYLCVLCSNSSYNLLQVIHDLRAGPVLRPNELAQDFAGAVDQISLRRARGLIKIFQFAIPIMDGEESDRVFTNKPLVVARVSS